MLSFPRTVGINDKQTLVWCRSQISHSHLVRTQFTFKCQISENNTLHYHEPLGPHESQNTREQITSEAQRFSQGKYLLSFRSGMSHSIDGKKCPSRTVDVRLHRVEECEGVAPAQPAMLIYLSPSSLHHAKHTSGVT